MDGKPSSDAPLQRFKAAYCERFHCRPEAFERRLFWRCLPLRAWPIAILFRIVHRHFFNADLDFLRGVGDARTLDEILIEANTLPSTPELCEGILRTPLRLRLSGRRLVAVARKVWPPAPREEWGRQPAVEARTFVAPEPRYPRPAAPKPVQPIVPPPPPTPQPSGALPKAAFPRNRSPYSGTGRRK